MSVVTTSPAAISPDECQTLHFPVACPKCDGHKGMPIKASTHILGGVIVDLRCVDCQHEWQCHLPAPLNVETRAKVDRRNET